MHGEGLVDAVDGFCDRIGFTAEQTRRVFDAARRLGLPVKLHAEQLSDQHGAVLAAEYGALSCDHLEYAGADGVAAMAAAGTVAVLLPGAFYFLRETQLPPVAALRAAGVPIAIATDHNPGSSPTLSPLLMLSMACTLFRLTPEEALRGMTVHAARALGLADRGTLAAGQRADFAVWDVEHPNELAYWFGRNPCARVVFGGVERPDERAGLHARSAARRRSCSACRTSARRSPTTSRPRSCRARSRSRTPTGTSPRSTASRARSARACSCRASRATSIDLNRPPENAPMYPGANNTELVPTRFFTGDPLYREGRVPTSARSRAGATRTGVRTTTRSPASSRASSPRTATRCSGTGTASRPSCRGCSKVGCPISTSAPRAARVARRRCAPR